MKAFFFNKKYYCVLNRNLGEINLVQKRTLESKILTFPHQKETGREFLLNLGDKEKIIYIKNKIITTIAHQAITSLNHGGSYETEIDNNKIIILDGMRSNLAY